MKFDRFEGAFTLHFSQDRLSVLWSPTESSRQQKARKHYLVSGGGFFRPRGQ